MTHSMTGYATVSGQLPPWRWVWEMRSVNGRGLDLRLRVPDWIDGLEPRVRAELKGKFARGTVTVGLRVSRDAPSGPKAPNPAAVAAVLTQIAEIQQMAHERNVQLAETSAAAVLSLVSGSDGSQPDDTTALLAAVLEGLPSLLDGFLAARAAEGAAMAEIISGQLDQVEAGTRRAREILAARQDQIGRNLRENLARVLGNTDGADTDRVAQELALIAVKSDVTEELDRLAAHIAQGRSLLADKGPIGRKFDFLTQEFNREANTLCSKAQFGELTRTGLDLKTVIDQMREQVQNLE